MSKFVRRIIPYSAVDVAAVQQYLENMSAKGLHFVSSGC